MTSVLRLSLPLTLWLVGFSGLYALQGFACSRHWPDGSDPRLVLIGAASVFVILQGLALAVVLARPARAIFVQATATALAAAALAAAVWTSLPVLALSICG
jgi:hypothetical protein